MHELARGPHDRSIALSQFAVQDSVHQGTIGFTGLATRIYASKSINQLTGSHLCKYSYATRVNPNCGLLRTTRAMPPLKNARGPSSRTKFRYQSLKFVLLCWLTDFCKGICDPIIRALSGARLDLEASLDHICNNNVINRKKAGNMRY